MLGVRVGGNMAHEEDRVCRGLSVNMFDCHVSTRLTCEQPRHSDGLSSGL